MINSAQILNQLIAFPTVSDQSNTDLIAFAADFLTHLGADVARIPVAPGKENLFARLGPAAPGGVVLAGHVDVVPTTGQNWSCDPFHMSEKDGLLYGRGACDMKGFIACAMASAAAVDSRALKKPFYIALTADEEVDMAGARALTAWIKGQDIAPAWMWLGEPTTMDVVSAHKGMNCVETHILGAPGHSGLPTKGLSAVHLAIEIGDWILNVAKARRERPIVGSPFDHPYTSFNIGVIAGGNADNVIAAQAKMLWELRPHPGDDPKDFWQAYETFLDQKIRPRLAAFPGTRVDTCVRSQTPCLNPSDGNPGVKILCDLLGAGAAQAVSYTTEAGWYQDICPHVVVCGPGDIKQAHKADEYIPRQDLEKCDALIARVLADYLC